MDFSSDTSAPAHPAVLDALARVNVGNAPSYGADDASTRVRALLASIFETDLEIWICASGTASNALALSLLCPPTGSVLCHREAHIEEDERGAVEFFTGGGRLSLLPGAAGKIEREALEEALAGIDRDFVHRTPPHALSLTNLTECGTAYSTAEIKHLAERAKAAGVSVHLDGARFANALASTGATPAEMSWRAGVDILTLGLTKTGAIGCEIIILFGDQRAKLADLKARSKRSGHMPPRARFLSAQAEAMLTNDLWLDLARQGNGKAKRLSEALAAAPGVTLAYPTDGNEVFVHLPDGLADALWEKGAVFYPWPGGSHRFVCAWSTPESDIQDLVGAILG